MRVHLLVCFVMFCSKFLGEFKLAFEKSLTDFFLNLSRNKYCERRIYSCFFLTFLHFSNFTKHDFTFFEVTYQKVVKSL